MRRVVDECADCDICRFLMDTSCLMFPELYRLWDHEQETGEPISSEQLRHLANRCNFCGLCPCPPVRANILKAKSEYLARHGIPPALRLMEDVGLLGRACGAWPQLTNAILGSKGMSGMIKKATGIHSQRRLPAFPRRNFLAWAKRQGLRMPPGQPRRARVAYFAGCTATYLYPEVAHAAVAMLQATGAQVWVPAQDCCGMPPLLEGDRHRALSLVKKKHPAPRPGRRGRIRHCLLLSHLRLCAQGGHSGRGILFGRISTRGGGFGRRTEDTRGNRSPSETRQGQQIGLRQPLKRCRLF